ncbi:acyltransferase [Saccharothrix sp. 6-C]|nr:acyltransferase [Saccharothrix sp. 6-C]
MRFIAALMVFAFHVSLEGVFADRPVGDGYYAAVNKFGFAGVSFFFILSGFVLTWSARETDTARGFWRRRLVKIYPNHVVTWAAAVVLMLAFGPAFGWHQAVPNLLLVHTWVPVRDVFSSMNNVSWSLACEVLFYLSFPVLLPLVKRIRPERLRGAAVAVAVAVLLVVPVAGALLPSSPSVPWDPGTSMASFWFLYVFPPVRALEFVLGMLVARLVLTRRWVDIGLGPATALVAAGYVVALVAPTPYQFAAATAVPLALLIGTGASADISGRRSPLRGRVAQWLGETSFAFYMVHWLVLSYGHRLLGGGSWSTPVAVLVVLGLLAVSLALAGALHAIVERPAMRRFGRSRAAAVGGGRDAP